MKIKLSLVLATFPFIMTSPWVSSQVRAAEAPIVNCSALIALNELFPASQLDQTRLVAIRFNPRIGDATLKTARLRLKALGFKPHAFYEKGFTLEGELNTDQLASASRLRAVESITRSLNPDEIEVWKNGRKRTTTTESMNAEPAANETELWKGMRSPIWGTPPRDLKKIRALAKQEGVTIVLEQARPSDQLAIKNLELLYGARIFFAGDLPGDSGMVHLPGLVLHIGPTEKALRVRGSMSILLGRGHLLALNKITEMKWIEKIDPTAIARSLTAEEVLKKSPPAKLEALRMEALEAVESYLKTNSPEWGKAREKAVLHLVQEVFHLAEAEFPQGAFFKWKFDAATRESGQMMTTFSSKPLELARRYLEDLRAVKRNLKSNERQYDEAFSELLLEQDHSFTAFVHSVLKDPGSLLVQEKLDVAITKDGNVFEFRDDILQGHQVNIIFRSGLEFYPELEAKVRKFMDNFLRKARREDRYITGGFDVMMLKNGKFKIGETNPGPFSSMIDAGMDPIDANMALSNLLGEPTHFIKYLETVYQQGFDAQLALLNHFLLDEPDEKKSVDDTPKTDLLFWLRGRSFEEWQKNPTEDRSREILAHFKKLIHAGNLDDDEYAQDIYKSIQSYFERVSKGK